MVGREVSMGRESTRREIFTICRSLLPVGEVIFLGRALETHTVQYFKICLYSTMPVTL